MGIHDQVQAVMLCMFSLKSMVLQYPHAKISFLSEDIYFMDCILLATCV
jgi:hypothetical protein